MPEEEKDKTNNGWLVAVTVVLVLYFGFFGAIYIDEVVLRTHWFSDVFGNEIGRYLRIIYSPLISLLELFQ